VSGRLSLLLVLGLLFGLCAWLGPPAKHRTEKPSAGPAVAAADVPFVSVRGRPLAPYEEPLPAGARVRIGSTRYRHPNSPSGWETTAVGRYVMTVPKDERTFTLTDTVTGRRVATETVNFGDGRASFVSCVASRDGQRLAIWQRFPASEIAAHVWEVSPNPVRPLSPWATVRLPPASDVRYFEQVAFSANGSELVLAANNSILRYDAATGGLLSVIPSQDGVIDLSADGSRFLAADDPHPRIAVKFLGGSGRRWVVPEYRFRARTAEAKPEAPTAVFKTDDSAPETQPLVLTVGDARSGNVVGKLTIPRQAGESVPHLYLAPDGRHLSFGFRGGIFVFDVDHQNQVLHLPPPSRPANAVPWQGGADFTTDGRRFVVSNADRRERAFELETGREVPIGAWALHVHDYLDRPIRADLATENGMVACSDPRIPLPPGYAGAVMDYSLVNELIAIGDATGRLDVWRTDGIRMTTLIAGGKGISAIAFSRDGHRLAACDRDRVVRVWSVGAWRERDRFEVPADSDDLCPERLTFSPDGRRLLVSQQDVMALWDFEVGQWAWDRPGHRGRCRYSPTFSPDGSRIHMFWNSFFDARTGTDVTNRPPDESRRERRPGRAKRIAWGSQVSAVSADGRFFAGLGDGGTLCVWPLGSDEVLREFPESRGPGVAESVLRFSPDARRLVTCDDAGHAHVWEVASGQLAFTLTYPDGAIHDVRFGADGRSLITSNHREVIVWDLMPEPGAAADPWAGLAAEAPQAEQARRALLADPAAAVELLKRRLRPAAPIDTATVAGLVTKLDAADYRERARATAAIQAIGLRVLPLLREATAHSEEAKTRLAAMIRELSTGPTAYELREIRAVEVLEQIGSRAARTILDELAAGDAGSVLTEEARGVGRRRSKAPTE
jgi:WD40 repeat protein